MTTTAPATAAGLPNVREQRPFGYWLRHIDRAIEQRMARLFAADALSRRDWQVLNTVACGPLSAAEVDATMAAFLGPEEPTMRPRLDALAARGWARTGEDGEVALTEDGLAAHRRISGRVAELRTRITAGLTPEEFRTLTSLLQRTAAHLDTLDTPDTAAA
ncbi:MarR family winged helix-turn-helix transcriptional regulator [Kitasatospora sp. NPDC093550]|uniref:MarR family winged helix-turn-helix transcriptional regulator n=1 Tax=Kitasatospora sp. NPDC093550 TaxID=3364089 RepID=UPI0038161AB6